VATLYRKASVDGHSQINLDSQRVKELMKKVTCNQDPELDKDFPKKMASND
jgi:2-methylcitrate dehydratase PrpD